jgi:hypothetical protein
MMPGPSSNGCFPQPAAPTTRAQLRLAREPLRLDEHLQVLARLERRDGEDVRAPRSAARRRPEHGFGAGCATRIRSAGSPSVAVTSRPVNAELTKTTSHVAAAFRYLRECIDRVLAVVHSGWWSGTRSWIVVARTPARCGGYIQSEKWSASNRRGDARPRDVRACSSRPHACDSGSGQVRSSTAIPRGERESARAADARRREGDDLVLAAARLGEAAERALDVVPDPEQRMAQRAHVEGDPHCVGR